MWWFGALANYFVGLLAAGVLAAGVLLACDEPVDPLSEPELELELELFEPADESVLDDESLLDFSVDDEEDAAELAPVEPVRASFL